MKNVIFTLTLILIFSFGIFGKGIDPETARKAAVNVYVMYNPFNKSAEDLTVTLNRVFTDESNTPLIYVFDYNNNEGFVIISADDIARPLIGYSFEGSFPQGQLIPSFAFWMKHYTDQIETAIREEQNPHPDAQAQWMEVLTSSPVKKNVKMVQPLLLTQWNQDDPYNELCPADAAGPGGHVYVGCVALAMGQAMKYYNYPTTGTGSHTTYSYTNGGYGTLTVNYAAQTYLWNNMPNRLTGSNLEVAKLLYHCAIAVDMNFAPDGSGSFTNLIASALKTYYKYASACSYKQRSSYTTTNWKNLLKAQVDAKKPMCYSGSGDGGGHAWNCDGYEGELFHMNWGWGGSANGFYDVDGLTAGGYTFTYNFGAVIDIYPASGYPETCSPTPKQITGAEGTFNDGSGNQNYANNSDCQYLINPTCGQKIQMNFDAMFLGTGDTIFVYNGNSTGSPLLGTYTAANIPATNTYHNANNGAMLIRFKTDGTDNAEGWYASYKVTYCSGTETYTDAAGTVSDGSGTCEYKNSSLCTFDLNPVNVSMFNLNFTSFSLPSADTNDYIMIYKNSMSTANLIGKYHGQNVPAQINIDATRLYVRFKSNATVTGGGFTFDYNATMDIPKTSGNLSQVVIFPNPSHGDAMISLDAAVPAEMMMTVIDITGKTIDSKPVFVKEGSNYLPFSVEKNGVYLIRLQNNSDIITLKFVKQ